MGLSNRKLRLGDILIEQGYITQEQLDDALKKQKKSKKRLGDYLVSEGILSDSDIAKALHIQLGIEIVELHGMKIDPDVISLVNGSVLRKHNVLPIGFNKNTNELLLAMSDPLDMVAQDDISIITNCTIEPRISTSSAINAVLDKYFGTDEAMSAAEQYSREKEQRYGDTEALAAEQDTDLSNAPIVQLVRSIIEQAVRLRASDIHLDAMERQIRVRYRIDGARPETGSSSPACGRGR